MSPNIPRKEDGINIELLTEKPSKAPLAVSSDFPTKLVSKANPSDQTTPKSEVIPMEAEVSSVKGEVSHEMAVETTSNLPETAKGAVVEKEINPAPSESSGFQETDIDMSESTVNAANVNSSSEQTSESVTSASVVSNHESGFPAIP